MSRLNSLVWLIVLMGVSTGVIADNHDLRNELVGAWRLVSTEQRMADGTRRPSPLYGKDGIGYLIYSESGRMCAMLTDPTRPKWKLEDAPSTNELHAVADHFVAYCGRYEVNQAESYVIHDVEMDVVPNNVGGKLKRYISLAGNKLILRPAEAHLGVVEYTLTWERVSK